MLHKGTEWFGVISVKQRRLSRIIERNSNTEVVRIEREISSHAESRSWRSVYSCMNNTVALGNEVNKTVGQRRIILKETKHIYTYKAIYCWYINEPDTFILKKINNYTFKISKFI